MNLEAIEMARKYIKQYSYREVANWLTAKTDRVISHVGLRKRLMHEKQATKGDIKEGAAFTEFDRNIHTVSLFVYLVIGLSLELAIMVMVVSLVFFGLLYHRLNSLLSTENFTLAKSLPQIWQI